ncbi:RES domain-containing protein [Arcicella rigui]|uniref:RES domain-containing protein n=1 Tax=Arcicella rigui TaxID=797020 RepID=A0ABU5Q6Z2_9BACT|nr:RES domain-containing protein [Arcicella rigui]MEA5138584.1 RES domain-containing protein [Arcicella rigui]
MNFPKIPLSKTFRQQYTPEQEIILKLQNGHQINKEEEDNLKEALKFYEELFVFLLKVDLTTINDEDAINLIEYLYNAFPFEVFRQNEINVKNLYRVSFVKDAFLENGKLKDLKYLRHPPKEIIQNLGVYGRANTPNSTVFYAALKCSSAIYETKPCVGQKIIISHWINDSAKKFRAYTISNNKTIDNEILKSATKSFQELLSTLHPLIAKILDLYMEFISSEFVKDIPVKNQKKYEYLYSAFFSDRILKNSFTKINDNEMPPFDCILYPSVATNYSSANLAIIPDSVTKLKPVYLEECLVLKTKYGDLNYSNNLFPINRQIIRTATKFEGERIIWSDD